MAVLGANGAGKSTLLALLSRTIYASEGQVLVLGRDRWDVHELRSQLGIVSPSLESRIPSTVTVREAVLAGFRGDLGFYRDEDLPRDAQEKAERALHRTEVANLAGRRLETLSSGERRRAMLARALAHDPKTLILDEPTASLDIAARHRFLELLQTLMREGLAVVLVTHHLEELLPDIDRVVLLRNGRVQADGPRSRIVDSKALSECFGIPLCVQGDGPYVAGVQS